MMYQTKLTDPLNPKELKTVEQSNEKFRVKVFYRYLYFVTPCRCKFGQGLGILLWLGFQSTSLKDLIWELFKLKVILYVIQSSNAYGVRVTE